MKKLLKILVISFSLVVVFASIVFSYFLLATKDISKLDDDKLFKQQLNVEIYDKNDEIIELSTNQQVNLSEIPSYVSNAFVSIEDKRFYSHSGLDFQGIMRALGNNIKSGKFSQGASTISQQLIKNTHLSSEKTLKRKFAEARLVKQLEDKYTKDEILTMYLNNIYFGQNCFGLCSATDYYFDKKPCELDISESAILAAIIKSPNFYIDEDNYEELFSRKNLVLKLMQASGYITNEEFETESLKQVKLVEKNASTIDSYINATLAEASDKLKTPKQQLSNLKIHTYLDIDLQSYAEDVIKNNSKYYANDNICVVLCNNNDGGISVFSSNNANLHSLKRQPASTVKPFLVYAPAFEKDLITPATIIDDEATNFDGYTPENYKNLYYGKVTARESLVKSLNIPAVKIYNTIDKGYIKHYSSSINIDIENLNLGNALGTIDKGISFVDLLSCYKMLANGGNYSRCTFIKSIEKDNKCIYKNDDSSSQVLSNSSTFMVNDILKDCAKKGTAKALECEFDICSKTGTQGTKNGNTDAYNVCYGANFTMINWIGNKESLLDNSVSGGTTPTQNAKKMLEIIENRMGINPCKNDCDLQRYKLDKISLYNDNKILLADENFDDNEVCYEYLRNCPNISERYSIPKVSNAKVSFENNILKIDFEKQTKYSYEIYILENNKAKLLDTVKGNKTSYQIKIDTVSEKVSFEIIPIFVKESGKCIKGKSIKTTEYFVKFKFENPPKKDDWWNIMDEFNID